MTGEKCRCQIVGWTRDPYEPHIPSQPEWEQADDCPVHPIPTPVPSEVAETTAGEHHPACYQSTGVPDHLPADLCDCKVLRMLDAAETTAGERDAARVEACDLDHGWDDNPARVYGHYGSPRTCIRLRATDEWVYDPAWEDAR